MKQRLYKGQNPDKKPANKETEELVKDIFSDSKEGLHTQGKWKVANDPPRYDRACQGYQSHVQSGINIVANIWGDTKEESKANAELIVKAVNERKALLDMIGKFCYKLQEHQKEDGKILKGYTLAANIPGMTELLIEATKILNK